MLIVYIIFSIAQSVFLVQLNSELNNLNIHSISVVIPAYNAQDVSELVAKNRSMMSLDMPGEVPIR